MHDVAKDELIGEDRRQHIKLTRWRRATFTGLALLTVVSLIATVFALGQRNQARQRADIALSRQLAAQSADAAKDSPALAALLAVEAYRKNPTPEAYSALVTSATRGPLAGVLHGEPVDGTAIAVYSSPTMAAYSRDGRYAAATGIVGDITVWDVKSERPSFVLRTSAFTSQLAFTGTHSLVAYDPGVEYTVWDLDKPTAPATQWLSPPDGVMSADGSTIVSSPKDSSELTITSVATRSGVRLTFPAGLVAFGVRADGGQVAALASGRLQWFDRAGKLLGSVPGPSNVGSPTLTVSDDGRTIATFSREEGVADSSMSLTLTDTASGATSTVNTDLERQRLSRFSPDNTKLAVASDEDVQLIDVKTHKTVANPFTVPGGMLGLAFRPDGSQLLTPTRDGESYVFDVAPHPSYMTVLATKGVVAATNARRTRLAVLLDRSLSVVDGTTGAVIGHTIALDALAKNADRAVAINDSGDAVAIMSGDQLTAYDVKTGSPMAAPVSVECGWSQALTFDGRTARVFHAPDVVTVVDVKAGRPRRDKPCPSERMSYATIDRTGRYAVFAEDAADLAFTKLTWWDIERDRTISDELFLRGDGEYTAPVVSPGGRFVLAGMTLRFVTRVFDLGKSPPTLGSVGAFSFPMTPSFSDNGMIIAFADQTTLSLFDVEHRRGLGVVLNLPGEFTQAVMAPGGESVIVSGYPFSSAIGSPDLVKVDLNPATMIEVACTLANRNLTGDEQAFYLGAGTSHATCPDLPQEPRSLQQRKDVPVISAPAVTTTTTTTRPTSTTRAATTTRR